MNLAGGGYDVEVIGQTSEEVYCIICLKIMKEPIQMECGHGMCKSCFENVSAYAFEKMIPLTCPSCRKVVDKNKTFHVKMLDRVILSLQVKCENAANGCEWVGELGDFQMHLNVNCDHFVENKVDAEKEVAKKIPSLISKHNFNGADICGTNDYAYIVRPDLGVYARTDNCNQASGIVTYTLHRNCIGAHYLSTSGKFYIIQGDKYRRVTNMNQDSGGTTYSLHENCRNGDFYFCYDSLFAIVFLERNKVHLTSNMNNDQRGKDINMPPDKTNVIYHWGLGKKHYCLKQSGWDIQYTRYSSFTGSEEDSYSFHTSLTKFLPGGLSTSYGPAISFWKQIYQEKNPLPSQVSVSQAIDRYSGFNITDTRLVACFGEDLTIKICGSQLLHDFAENDALKSYLIQEKWQSGKTVQEKISLTIKPNKEIFVWQYILGFVYSREVYFTKYLAFTETNKEPDNL